MSRPDPVVGVRLTWSVVDWILSTGRRTEKILELGHHSRHPNRNVPCPGTTERKVTWYHSLPCWWRTSTVLRSWVIGACVSCRCRCRILRRPVVAAAGRTRRGRARLEEHPAAEKQTQQRTRTGRKLLFWASGFSFALEQLSEEVVKILLQVQCCFYLSVTHQLQLYMNSYSATSHHVSCAEEQSNNGLYTMHYRSISQFSNEAASETCFYSLYNSLLCS
jgi:hypothetical protein